MIRVDLLSGFRLIAEPAEELRIVRELRTQHLDGNFTVIDHVICQPHGGHAPVADDPLQAVIRTDQFLQAVFSS